jgi:hypothetical protein
VNLDTNTLSNAVNNIGYNTSNIATNTANIATNTANIATNASTLANAVNNIGYNTYNIAQNTSDITNLALQVAGDEASNAAQFATVNNNLLLHKSSGDHDSRYYTIDQINNRGGYLNDDRYYTKAEIAQMLPNNIMGGEETFIATANQALFTLVHNTYTPGMNMVQVYVQGVRLAQSDVQETSSTSVTLPSCPAGTEVIISLRYVAQSAPATPIFAGPTAPINPTLYCLWVNTSGGI